MIEVKTFTGGLNSDDNQYRVPPDDYIDALNVSHDAVEGSNDQVITPLVANRLISYTYNDSGTAIVIGAKANTLRNTIIEFACHTNGYHCILELNLTTRVRTKIFENLTDSGDIDVLGFLPEKKIRSIDIYNRDEGDLLFFLDSLGRPTGLDIELFRSGTYTPVTRAILDKAKKPPLSPPSVIYDNDSTRRSNNFRNKLFRFKYRWIYDDFEKSSFSPISKVPLPVSILSDAFTSVITNNNVIQMVANTGDKNVKSIEVGMSFVEKTNTWSDFASIALLDKSDLGLKQTNEVFNGTAGYDVAAATLSGTASAGTIVNAYLILLPNTQTLVGTYTVLAGDTLPDVAAGIVADMVTKGIVASPFSYGGQFVYTWDDTTYSFGSIEIISSNPDNDNIDFPFSFYNDSTYPSIDIEESIELFDYVPPKANAQALLNGNILAYIGITEGYDKDTAADDLITIETIPAGGSGGGSSFVAVKTVIGSSDPTKQIIRYTLSGIPAVGTVVEVKVKRRSDHVVLTASTYTTILNDTIYTIEVALTNNNTLSPSNQIFYNNGSIFVHTSNVTYEPIVDTFYSDLVITPPSSATETNSIPTFKWSTERNIARAYFDEKGVTNGILYSDRITFPAYAENGSQQPLLPFINYKINDIPPVWAKSMQFYLNKDETIYIYWVTNSVNKEETAYIYFDVSNFTLNASKKPTTATVLSYTFQDGDRLRVIRDKEASGVVFNDTYDAAIEGDVVDPTINSTPKTGRFIKIKNIAPFTSGLDSTKNYVIEIYRPVQQTANTSNQVYYEFGQQYDIIDAGLSTRRHSGMVTDQVVGVTPAEFNFYDGDAYFRQRTIAVSEIGYAIYNVMDRNFVDNYISAVSSVDGRPSIIDLNARQAYYSTLIRHGEAYQANTNINGLNRFYAKNFDEYDYSFGDGMALVVKNRQLIVLQKYKIGAVTLYSSIGKDANGLTVVFQTDKLLNPIQYYEGDFGIGTCPESIASFNFAVYGCDNIKGVVWRLSKDGLVPLSIIYKMNSWANDNLPLRKDDIKVYGAFDQRLNNYIVHLEAKECISVEAPSFTINEAFTGYPFAQTVILVGTLPITLENIVKPAWLSIVVSGYNLVFSGNPVTADAGAAPVSFDIVNDCGVVPVDTVMTTTVPPCIAVNILGRTSPFTTLPSGSIGVPYSASYTLTGTAPFIVSAITAPSWVSVNVVGSSVVISGTPDTSGDDITVNFTVSNCGGSGTNFTGKIDISAENWFIYYTNNDASVNIQLHIGNNNSAPSATIYNGLYTSDPVSGSDITNLPAVNAIVVLSVAGGKTITMATCNGVNGIAGGASVTWTGVTSGTLSINFITT